MYRCLSVPHVAVTVVLLFEIGEQALEAVRNRLLYHFVEQLPKLTADVRLSCLLVPAGAPPSRRLAPLSPRSFHHFQNPRPLPRCPQRSRACQAARLVMFDHELLKAFACRATTDSVALSGPKSLDADTPSISVNFTRARLTRLLIVPYGAVRNLSRPLVGEACGAHQDQGFAWCLAAGHSMRGEFLHVEIAFLPGCTARSAALLPSSSTLAATGRQSGEIGVARIVNIQARRFVPSWKLSMWSHAFWSVSARDHRRARCPRTSDTRRRAGWGSVSTLPA